MRLTYEDRPLAGALIVAFNRKNPAEKVTARTDKDGRVQLRLRGDGLWLIKGVHMIPSATPDADWLSYWASLTLQVGSGEMKSAILWLAFALTACAHEIGTTPRLGALRQATRTKSTSLRTLAALDEKLATLQGNLTNKFLSRVKVSPSTALESRPNVVLFPRGRWGRANPAHWDKSLMGRKTSPGPTGGPSPPMLWRRRAARSGWRAAIPARLFHLRSPRTRHRSCNTCGSASRTFCRRASTTCCSCSVCIFSTGARDPSCSRSVHSLVAHSITLGLSLYGLVSVSPAIVEPLIALSIAYVAIENIFLSELEALAARSGLHVRFAPRPGLRRGVTRTRLTARAIRHRPDRL